MKRKKKYKVLYVAPRYHTNQISIISGWIEQGDEVLFISQYVGNSEDYSVLEPVILGYSVVFETIARIYRALFCRKEKSLKKEFDFRTKIGFPPARSAEKYISEFQPDIVIVRERSIYNIPFVRVCKKKNIPCILYNQSPLWDYPDRDNGMLKKILLPYFPPIRITPVLGVRRENKIIIQGSVFVPFVIKPHYSWEEKEHFQEGNIHLLCVGRYEERKNLLMLLEIIDKIKDNYPIFLTIVGECKNINQQEYYNKMEKFIQKHQMSSRVILKKNCNINQVYEEYRKADLFVLPSTKERASISQLEAMSCSLPVICSDTNGSACYIENGKNGYIFRDNVADDLQKKIESIIGDREKLIYMGKMSYRIVKDKYLFENYKEKICEIIEDISYEANKNQRRKV